MSRDITGRKEAEAALQYTQNELEQRVRDRTAELISANKKLNREIDERKLAEIALRESEERFRNLFETAQDCIFIKDRELRYTHINPAMLRKLGVVQSQVIRKTDEDLFSPAYSKQSRKLESRVLQGESVETEQNLRLGDRICIFNIIRSPMRDASGKISGVYGMARDLTDRRLLSHDQLTSLPDYYMSPAMRNALSQTRLAAKSDSAILFLGESGTGKDHLARYLHETSNRANGPFIVINCAALPEQLVESELFGHEAGAFTGSSGRKRGLVELAESGTFLLNEVGELPLRIQAKLLAFLDNQSFMRVGGEKQILVNSRVIAASNLDLEMEVRAGNFRADLYYRLNVFSVHVPPLRSRLEDLPILVRELLEFLSKKMDHTKIPTVDKTAMVALTQYKWPGNVRELRNVLERALILCGQSDQINPEHLGLSYQPGSDSVLLHDIPLRMEFTDDLSFPKRIFQIKKILIEGALVHSGGGIKKTATILGITRDSLIHHMKSLGIHR